MLLSTVVLATAMAGAGAPSASAGDEAASVNRRRPANQCRIVDPSPRRAGRRGAEEDGAALQRSRARAFAALRRSQGDAWAALPRGERRRQREEIRKGRFYSAATTLDLELGVVVRRSVPSDAWVELRLLTPEGHLYQTLRVAASSPAEAKSARAAGKPASSREGRSARATPPALTAAVPVAGTAIVNHSLYGQWTVEPRLDGQPCGAPVRFWIGE